MNKKLLELAVLPMVLQAPGVMPEYGVTRAGYQKPGRTTTKAHRRKKRAQNKARNRNRR